jgi:general secretion pathway protein D
LERTRGGGVISKIIPDEQTNSLIVLANQAGFVSLQQLVGKLDVKVTDTGRIHVYYCEYAKAEDLASTLASLSGGGGGNSKTSSRKTNVSSPSAIGGGGAAPAPGSSGPVTAELDGGVKITSDAPTNSLVITANASDYKTIKRVIKKLDIPRLQVFVETAIMEINLDNNDKLGVNTAIGAPVTGYGGGFIGDSETLTTFLSQSGLPSGATVPIFAGPSFQANVAGKAVSVNSFMGLLNLLKKTTDSSILSTPQIIALDNEKAEFKVQDEIPVIGSSIAATATSGATQNVTTLKTGIEVKLTPHVNAASRSIRLEIEQTVDSLRGNTDVPEALAKTNKAKTSRVTNTSVVVKDQDFVMMGGLISDSVEEGSTKVPLLGDIPILGWLFKSKTLDIKKKNLVILLRPQIIGTTLASANLIEERLKARDEFLNSKGKQEPHKSAMDGYKKKLKEQKERGIKERTFDYRNNGDEDDDTPQEKPAEVSELAPKPTKQSKAPKNEYPVGPNNEDNAPLLPQQPDVPSKQEETL